VNRTSRLSAAGICDRLVRAELQAVESILLAEEASLDSISLARRIVDIVEEKQASDIVLLDVHEQTSIADYFIVATVETDRQARAIEEEMRETLRLQQNIRPLNIEGADGAGSGWVLLDYGDVIVHLLTGETRQRLDLETLWDKASVVVKVF
jgi:ribosome-associated protein